MISLIFYACSSVFVTILFIIALAIQEKEFIIMKKSAKTVNPIKFQNMLGLYCVYDKSAQRYGDPVCYANDKVAVRVFRSMCAVPGTPRDDFELYCIGTFYNGKIVSTADRMVKLGRKFTDKELIDTYVSALRGELYDEAKADVVPVSPEPENLGECLTGPLSVESEVKVDDNL